VTVIMVVVVMVAVDGDDGNIYGDEGDSLF
jgi:hypothetical protein